jgi:pimeloyl-ACP methyl ester carboxylesterase
MATALRKARAVGRASRGAGGVSRSSGSPGLASFSKFVRCRVLVASLVAGVCAVLLVGASTASSSARPAAAPHRTAGAGIAWRSCGKRLQCARVRVPLDWEQPTGATISLAVIRHLASRRDRRIGSLFVNFGGPGEAAVPTVRADGASLDAYGRGRFDVVGWDPRGVGASTHVQCFANPRSQATFWGSSWSVPTTKAASRRYVGKTVAFVNRCVALSGRLLAHISTADTARDLDYLRALVGDRQLTYLGLSYGSFLGETYANMFPGRVRAMVLDSIIDPVAFTTSVEAQSANAGIDSNLVFAKFESLCQRAGPARCALAGHGSVAAGVRRLLARLRRGPIPAPMAAPSRKLSYGDLVIGVFAQLGGPAGWPQLASWLAQAEGGDGSTLESEIQLARPAFQSALVAATALDCADKPPPRQGPQAWPSVIGRLTRISQFFGPVLGWWVWAPCASWPVPSTNRYTGPWNASTRNPILVIGTRFDPKTPFANARRVARLLGNAVLLTHDGYGHISSSDPSQCIERATSTYLIQLKTPPKGTVCPSDRQPFDPNFGKPLP